MPDGKPLSSLEVAKVIVDETFKFNGATVSIWFGSLRGQELFPVGGILQTQIPSISKNNFTISFVTEYVDKYRNFLIEYSDCAVGTWIEDNGLNEILIKICILCKTEEIAKEVGLLLDQRSTYSLKDGKEIEIGGSDQPNELNVLPPEQLLKEVMKHVTENKST